MLNTQYTKLKPNKLQQMSQLGQKHPRATTTSPPGVYSSAYGVAQAVAAPSEDNTFITKQFAQELIHKNIQDAFRSAIVQSFRTHLAQMVEVAYVTIEGNTNTLSTAIGGAIGGQNDF